MSQIPFVTDEWSHVIKTQNVILSVRGSALESNVDFITIEIAVSPVSEDGQHIVKRVRLGQNDLMKLGF